MFTVHLTRSDYGPNRTLPLKVYIEGCPSSGIAAVDFRRNCGLPEAPTSLIELPPYSWQDEEFIRGQDKLANDSANIECCHLDQWEWYCNGTEVYQSSRRTLGNPDSQGYYPFLRPGVIAAYLKEQAPATGRAVVLDLLDGTIRSNFRALAEACRSRQEQEAALKLKEEARTLLKDEFARLDDGIKERDRTIAGLEKEITELREALQPFADLMEECEDADSDDPNERLVSLSVDQKDIQRAKEVLDN